MSIQMRVEQATLYTAEKIYKFPFRGSASILEGPVGTGKSSLLELVKHGLGGTAVLTPVVRQEVSQVDVHLSVAGASLILRRGFGRSGTTIRIVDPYDDSDIRELPIKNRPGESTVSDYLLETLGLPKVNIPRARTRSTAANVPLTFNDIYSYLYVEQQEIDRSIIHHTESFREPKRRAVFELLFGLADPSQMRAETDLGVVKDKIRGINERLVAIKGFLRTAKVDDEERLKADEVALAAQAEEAFSGLAQLRREVSSITTAHQELRSRVIEAEREVQSAIRRLGLAKDDVDRRERLLAQSQVDLSREDKVRVASSRIAPLEFVVCPRCMQELDESRASASICVLYLQPEPHGDQPSDNSDFDELGEQIDELTKLLEMAHSEADHANKAVIQSEHRLAKLRAELDEVTAEAVSPKFGEIELLSSRHARATSEIARVRQLRSFWDELRSLESDIKELHERKADLESKISVGQDALLARRLVIDDINELFDETVRELQVPWAQTARVDERNFLPLINGERFESVAVAGGTKTIVSVAYHLTLLAYALSHDEVQLPRLLILDTPRKNLGANESDTEMGHRIYRRIRTLVDVYGANVQFIVADNDVPTERGWNVIHFDYDKPLLAHVVHPGEEAAISGQLETVGSSRK